MEDLLWFVIYAVPVVIVVGIPVLIWVTVRNRRAMTRAERAELERLRAQAQQQNEGAA